MGLLADLRTRALTLTKELTDNVVDSGHAAVYLRQLLRGNGGGPAPVPRPDPPPAPAAPPVLYSRYPPPPSRAHLPCSPFLQELSETPLPKGVDVVSIGALRDWLAPVASTALAGVRHIALPTGHSGLLVDEQVADLVAGILRELEPAAQPHVDDTP